VGRPQSEELRHSRLPIWEERRRPQTRRLVPPGPLRLDEGCPRLEPERRSFERVRRRRRSCGPSVCRGPTCERSSNSTGCYGVPRHRKLHRVAFEGASGTLALEPTRRRARITFSIKNAGAGHCRVIRSRGSHPVNGEGVRSRDSSTTNQATGWATPLAPGDRHASESPPFACAAGA